MNKAVILRPFQRLYKKDAAQNRASTQSPVSRGSGRWQKPCCSPTAHLPVLDLCSWGNVCACSFPPHVQTVCTNPLSPLRAGWCCCSTRSGGTELTPTGKGGRSAPCPQRMGWAQLVATVGAEGQGRPGGSPPVPALCSGLPRGHPLCRRAAGGARQAVHLGFAAGQGSWVE